MTSWSSDETLKQTRIDSPALETARPREPHPGAVADTWIRGSRPGAPPDLYESDAPPLREVDLGCGDSKHDPACRDGGNSRNGHRAKTVITQAEPWEISVPRDRDSSFDPKIVAKRQRRLTGVDGVDDMVISQSGTFWGGYGGGEQTRTSQPR